MQEMKINISEFQSGDVRLDPTKALATYSGYRPWCYKGAVINVRVIEDAK